MKSLKDKTIFNNALRFYHNLDHIEYSDNPDQSEYLKDVILDLLSNSNLSLEDSMNLLKNCALEVCFFSVSLGIDELEKQQKEKFKRELK